MLAITKFLLWLPCQCLELFLKTGVSLGPQRKALCLLNSAEKTAVHHGSLSSLAWLTKDTDLTDLDEVTEDDTSTRCLLHALCLMPQQIYGLWNSLDKVQISYYLALSVLAETWAGPECQQYLKPLHLDSQILSVGGLSKEEVAAQISEQEGRQERAPQGSGMHAVCTVHCKITPWLIKQTMRQQELLFF